MKEELKREENKNLTFKPNINKSPYSRVIILKFFKKMNKSN